MTSPCSGVPSPGVTPKTGLVSHGTDHAPRSRTPTAPSKGKPRELQPQCDTKDPGAACSMLPAQLLQSWVRCVCSRLQPPGSERGVCPSSGSQQGYGTGPAALPRCAWALQPSTGIRESMREMRGSEEGSEEALPRVVLSPAEQLPQLLTSRFQPGKRQHPASQKPQTSFFPLILPVLPG